MTSSRGKNLAIETTSAALLVWYHDYERYEDNILNGLDWLITQTTKGGSTGSTQATIMTLLALKNYLMTFPGVNGDGVMAFKINGN
mmetsp:Transcript_22028/g.21209  ORF Transcript_22028/g.21209 Transcript_22028/m.21209 type:complete len:86 (+) Transcript_22028:2577-2834(+)|eukprot:CAMPEP_0170546020 /NCGR_PEP_ID=MMETSP0211-20121228/4400_1 /TAXON_ID=311385 /ORGANISM="Pseudokeronopsis sp., Strain OXSARD2" /LENGTH=85 /DNA_ID=CAMNT_0010850261 /DNA_START=4010 /DNA_END=4267 /DNA_ORIENTATION=+